MDEIKKQLKAIIERNSDLQQRIREGKWKVKYNKPSDMIIMGEAFPADSFYFYLNGSGVMIRIDSDNRIYGFAIEDAKYFIKNNPDIGWLFMPLVYPLRYFWLNAVYKVFGGFSEIRRIFAVSEYIAGEACYL